ncbi:jg26189 [Pararge aegeria aegeria]|uniref:Jg26189 protein n=1 Tax=Pararge aegeria aegeria TaxID=348720 RepID=A0A8S4QM35_9NEOP|nr:jg26189 [Pararge aegeria aegeria]
MCNRTRLDHLEVSERQAHDCTHHDHGVDCAPRLNMNARWYGNYVQVKLAVYWRVSLRGRRLHGELVVC